MDGRVVLREPLQVCQLLERVFGLLKEEKVFGSDINAPIVRFKHPDALQTEMELDIGKPINDSKLLILLKDVIYYSLNTQHPLFLNQLYGALDPYGLAGSWISEALNTNQHTYEVAPVFTLVEMAVIDKVLRLFGFQGGDGIFTPGGSMANIFAMTLARYRVDPEIKRKGLLHLPPLVAFVSVDSHYSIIKAAHLLGIGTDNVITVETDSRGWMIPSKLVSKITEALTSGKKPFFVTATAGTTVLGAFDPFDEIADICQEYQLWLHVDACWGGSLIFSKKYTGALKGTERADSLSWNPHKMLGAPLQCSIFILKEKDLLHQCNSASASYLFQKDKFYDTNFDTGDKTIQCGRKTDAFKLWVMWKARGDSGFSELVDNAMDTARYFKQQISNKPGFRLVLEDFQCTNVCFWYIPETLRNKPETDEWNDKLNTIAPSIKEQMVLSGTLMIGYQPLQHKNLCNFFRLVTRCHPPLTKQDIDIVIREIEEKAKGL